MNNWFIVGFIFLIAFVIVVRIFIDWPDKKFHKIDYKYRKRIRIMTESEIKCFNILIQTVGDKYYVFPQIHLPTFLDHKIVGQNWGGAFRHIDEKSVDFVLCDKENMCPILAIELDDRTHEQSDRQERDREVESMLEEAEMPLLRLKNQDITSTALSKHINASLNKIIIK